MNVFEKPFYEMKTKEEFISWFKTREPWNKLDGLAIESIVDKFVHDNLAFQSFMYVSEKCNLIQNNYIPLRDRIDNIDLLLSNISLTLYRNGGYFRDKLIEEIKSQNPNPEKVTDLLKTSQLSYETSIILNEYSFGAYFQIAFLRGEILEKLDQGIKWCNKGLEKIGKLKAMPVSQLNDIEKASLNDIEQSIELFNEAIYRYELQLKKT